MRSKEKALGEMVGRLRKEWRTPHPVRVALTTGLPPQVKGTCTRNGRTLHIHLNSRFPLYVLQEVLLHEWAHAITWPHARLERHQPMHPDEWALAYGRLYRWWYDEEEEEK